MITESARDSIIVALDCDIDEARRLANQLSGHARWLKVGMTLYYAAGPAIVKELTDLGFKVFVDLKLHDIPHQVQGAAKSLAKIGASMITIHASGGPDMMRAACDAIAEEFPQGEGKPIVLAITVLTSTDEAMLKTIGVAKPLPEQVEALARMADDSGCDGVVCSPQEADVLRVLLGDGAAIVTPGIRPQGSAKGDQSRISTPSQAIKAGASHLVIGRPITQAVDPVLAFETIVRELEEELS